MRACGAVRNLSGEFPGERAAHLHEAGLLARVSLAMYHAVVGDPYTVSDVSGGYEGKSLFICVKALS